MPLEHLACVRGLIRVVEWLRRDGLFHRAYVHERDENFSLSLVFDLSTCACGKRTIDERWCTSIFV